MTKKKQEPPFTGRWPIDSMSAWEVVFWMRRSRHIWSSTTEEGMIFALAMSRGKATAA